MKFSLFFILLFVVSSLICGCGGSNSNPQAENDSIFVRNPKGERIFVGKGPMSLEKLVEKESTNLSQNYEGVLNEHLEIENAEKMAQIMKELNLSSELCMLFGNVMLIKIDEEKANIRNYKFGEILEIASRIQKSAEYKAIEKI